MELYDLSRYELIVIWGCGREIRKYKKQFYIDYIVDKNVEKVGQMHCGIPVKAINELVQDAKARKPLVVVSAIDYYKEIVQEIKELNIDADIAELHVMNAIYGCDNQSFALWGIDVLVRDLFVRAGYELPEISYIEVGANHPIHGNATENLYIGGARGMLIEPNPDLQETIQHYRDDKCLMCGVASEQGKLEFYRFDNSYRNTFDKIEAEDAMNKGFRLLDTLKVEVETLDDIIDENSIDTEKTFLSIQTMGLEMEVLKNFDYKRHRFPIIAIAYYTDEIFKHPIFEDYCEIGRVPRHVVLVTNEIYKKILG